MKNAKKILAVLIVLVLMCASLFALASCKDDGCQHTDEDGDGVCDKCGESIGDGACEHTDEDKDGICDKCGEAIGDDVAEVLELISSGVVNFKVVKTSELKSAGAKAASALVKDLKALGLAVDDVVSDGDADAVSECEIIIGSGARLREGCNVDYHTLGKDGYIIKVVGKRVVIAGGTDATLCEAVEIFRKEVLGLTDSTTSLSGATVSISTDTVYERGSEYPLLDIRVGEKGASLMKGYYLSYDASNSKVASNAYTVRNTIYNNSGLWLPLESELGAGESAAHLFIVREVEDAGKNAFRVYVDDNDNLIMECSFTLHMERGVTAFLNRYIDGKTGVSRIYSKDVFEYAVNVVRYTEFGAKGDGKADDFKAMLETHEYANQYGVRVIEDQGLTYYIGPDSYGSSISIQTDVDFGNAKFIIDDTKLKPDAGAGLSRQLALFSVAPSENCRGVKVDSSLLEGLVWTVGETTNLGLTFDGPMMLAISSDAHQIYIRYGANSNNGANIHENLLVSADGTVDPTTPLTFTYPHVSSVTAYSIDETPITIEGGTFTTYANQLSYSFDYPGFITGDQYYYYSRNINVTRSNVTIKNVKHYVEKEQSGGYPYSGFFSVGNCYNVLVSDCVVTGHRAYTEDRDIDGDGQPNTDKGTTMGSYDIGVGTVINCTFKNVIQSNSITSNFYWGIMGSNYARNVTYDGCYLSRFDAHCGIYNATVKNTTIGFAISLTGNGEFYAENVTKLVGDSFISLRSDYGSTWNGSIILKNIHMAGYQSVSFAECNKNNMANTFYIITASWADWEFGHDVYMPKEVLLDGFTAETNVSKITVNMLSYSNFTAMSMTSVSNPMNIDPNMTVSINNIADNIDVYMSPSASDYVNSLFKNGTITDGSAGTKKIKSR